ncbi:MAG: hydroxylamine oxidase, partial [Nitrospirae bacterium]
MRILKVAITGFFILILHTYTMATENKISPQTQACIGCHQMYTPGIVKDWLSSRHSMTTPAEAVKKPALERRISVEQPPEGLSEYVVGCYECHSQ